MHLGLKKGPFVPHTEKPSHGRPDLHRSSRLPPDSAPNIIWIKKRAEINLIRDAPFPELFFICLSKVSAN
jgi:hypothetical protein